MRSTPETPGHTLPGAILDASHAAIFALDRDLRVTAFNRAYARMMKDLYGAATSAGVSLRQQMRGAGEDAERMQAILERVLGGESAREESLWGAGGRLRRRLAFSFDPVRAQGGEVSGAVVIAQEARVEAAPDPAAAAASSSPPPPPPSGRADARILLVEDDDGVRELMADILESQGYSVTATGRPAEALELAASLGTIDLLVTDVIMPGMSGHELAARLVEARTGLRTLYVSGYAGEALARYRGIDHGERFLQKPFSERGLLESVAAALSPPPDDGRP